MQQIANVREQEVTIMRLGFVSLTRLLRMQSERDSLMHELQILECHLVRLEHQASPAAVQCARPSTQPAPRTLRKRSMRR